MIYIFSKAIYSGKTTELFEWCSKQKSCGGILMPNFNGSKIMFDVESKTYFNCIANDIATEKIFEIGKYHFLQSAFHKANKIIISSIFNKKEFVVIDEIGKLEINKEGFYESLDFIIHQQHFSKIILVVRDVFVEEARKAFRIEKCEIVDCINGV